jgi:hypothetical protein
MSDPLIRHLRDLVSVVPPDSVILAGGLGLMLKRRHLALSGTMTLANSSNHEHPEARATTDIDLFLKIELFTRPEQGRRLRRALDGLHYIERTPKWQFEKPLNDALPNQFIVVDLLARQPDDSEDVRVRTSRVGSGSGTDLHGHETVEAFAVECKPQNTTILDEGQACGQILTAHPYAWLNMKVRAAHDWLRFQAQPWKLRENQLPPSAKHAFDAALIVAMITEVERDECVQMATKFRDHPVAVEIRTEATELFGSPTALGWREAIRQGMFDDHDLIWPTLKEMLGTDG